MLLCRLCWALSILRAAAECAVGCQEVQLLSRTGKPFANLNHVRDAVRSLLSDQRHLVLDGTYLSNTHILSITLLHMLSIALPLTLAASHTHVLSVTLPLTLGTANMHLHSWQLSERSCDRGCARGSLNDRKSDDTKHC